MMSMPKWEISKETQDHITRTGCGLSDMLGFLPMMLDDEDPNDAKTQLHEGYSHGGGWCAFQGFTYDPEMVTLHYPGDPPMRCIGKTKLRDEEIILFESSWVAIVQPDGNFITSRMD